MSASFVERITSVGDLHHGEPDDLLAQHEAGLKDLGHGVLAKILVLHMHDRVVQASISVMPSFSSTDLSWFMVISTPFL